MNNNMKTTAQIRADFLNFFQSKGHQIVESSSLVPHDDPTLLFTNAGMNQFKNLFLGNEKRDYVRATTSQRCVRAGGKHNDLENVGYTARHHTFFEMLGNFSFGDYFKTDAIKFAWEFLTSDKWLALPKDKLWVTVYHEDDEAFDIWHKEVGLAPERIIRIGDKKGEKYNSDNFWQMGDVGPCGPSSEIFYDHGDHIWGGLPGSPEEDGDRYIEIWNLVFMQFNRTKDGTMNKLPKPSVDTGMGLERIAAVLQHVNSNYEIDLFKQLIKNCAEVLGVNSLDNKSLRVISDHIRSCSYLIADGVVPSNEGRGYVLRRIIRRAVRHGHILGAHEKGELFFYKLLPELIKVMADAGQILQQYKAKIEQYLQTEEEQFIKTLERGLLLLSQEISVLKGNVLSGEVAFKLYDTFGFPLDLTADMCREKDIEVDFEKFDQLMDEQRKRAQQSSNFHGDYSPEISVEDKTEFLGYSEDRASGKILAISTVSGEQLAVNASEQEVVLVLDRSPFYAQAGGQIGDCGVIKSSAGSFIVEDCQKKSDVYLHFGKVVSGEFNVGDTVESQIDVSARAKIAANHSSTHLLHAALRQVLGTHVAQKGSLVNDKILRFDISHPKAVSSEEIKEVEQIINHYIRANLEVVTNIMDLEDAKKTKAMALFGEKYADKVRVVSMGDFSVELCGGTHVKATGDIGLVKIISEQAIAAGVRRIEAVSGAAAVELMQNNALLLDSLKDILKTDASNFTAKLDSLFSEIKKQRQELTQLKQKNSLAQIDDLVKQAEVINGAKVVTFDFGAVDDVSLLRSMVDKLKQQGINLTVLLFEADGKLGIMVGVKDLALKAGDLVKLMANASGAKGGGRPDFAMAGGGDLSQKSVAVKTLKDYLVTSL